MFDRAALDKKTNKLMRSGQVKEAEDNLLKAYAESKAANNVQDLEWVLNRMAQFYSSPDTEDRDKAEHYFLEREALSSGLYARLQTATFYFYVLRNFPKTIHKVDEMKALREVTASPSYYSALTLKGQAFIELGKIDSANQVLEEMLLMIKMNSSKLPYGDEFNLLEAAMSNEILAARSRVILNLVIPRIRSQEYVEKAKALLESA